MAVAEDTSDVDSSNSKSVDKTMTFSSIICMTASCLLLIVLLTYCIVIEHFTK